MFFFGEVTHVNVEISYSCFISMWCFVNHWNMILFTLLKNCQYNIVGIKSYKKFCTTNQQFSLVYELIFNYISL